MPRRRFIDKKNATHFALVHRAQDDPLINDEDAPDMVFAEFSAPNINKPSSSKK
ncbi:Protein ltv1, partial [Cryomyces antarcticus]